MPQYHWLYLKAQCYQESLLNPRAVSPAPAFAKGICQFTDDTWVFVSRAMGWDNVSPFNAKANIYAAAWYMRYLVRQWYWEREDIERLILAWASYNAGLGRILAAQQLALDGHCGDPRARNWEHIAPCLQHITGADNSSETLGYVERIKKWYGYLFERHDGRDPGSEPVP